NTDFYTNAICSFRLLSISEAVVRAKFRHKIG
ncbi:MAG: hypothetical protein ACI84C_001626, partial [Flavobacteriales bacterium]